YVVHRLALGDYAARLHRSLELVVLLRLRVEREQARGVDDEHPVERPADVENLVVDAASALPAQVQHREYLGARDGRQRLVGPVGGAGDVERVVGRVAVWRVGDVEAGGAVASAPEREPPVRLDGEEPRQLGVQLLGGYVVELEGKVARVLQVLPGDTNDAEAGVLGGDVLVGPEVELADEVRDGAA